MLSSLKSEVKISRFLEISKKLSENPTENNDPIAIVITRMYFFNLFVIFMVLGHVRVLQKDDKNLFFLKLTNRL